MNFLFAFTIFIGTISCTVHSKLDNSKNDSIKLVPSNILGKSLISVLEVDGKANIFVTMENTTESTLNDISSLKFDSRPNLATSVLNALLEHADRTQKQIVNFLQSKNHKHNSFWATNEIYIENATVETVNSLVSMGGVSNIDLEEIFPTPTPVEMEVFNYTDEMREKGEVLWNMERIGIPCAWKQTNGLGIIVANIDTGVRGDHEILKKNYKKELSWFNPEDVFSKSPFDDSGHGTHTMGTIAGQNGFGVAPGAQWIACKGCGKGCKRNWLLKCLEWVMCPFRVPFSGEAVDYNITLCIGVPHVVNNSWGGGQGTKTFDSAIHALKTAGIIPVFSQGNSGPNCTTANSPGDSANVIGVGATNSSMGIAYFSSRGPTIHGDMKPDISAPGHRIVSSFKNSSSNYATLSGTSMAAPHITGVVALILSSGKCDQYYKVSGFVHGEKLFNCVYEALIKYTNAVFLEGKTCNSVSNEIPNYSYGYGIVNAYASLMSDREKMCNIVKT